MAGQSGRSLAAAVGVAFWVAAAPASRALTIDAGFYGSLSSQGAASMDRSAIAGATSTIDGLFGNAGTVSVLFELNPSLGNGAGSDTTVYALPYYGAVLGQSHDFGYRDLLAIDAGHHPKNSVLNNVLKYLPGGVDASSVANDASGAASMVLTSADLRVALGVAGVRGCFNASGGFVASCSADAGAKYDAVVMIGGQNPYRLSGSLFAASLEDAVEHELDEVLGGGGAGSTIGTSLMYNPHSGAGDMGATDLLRYAASGTSCSSVTSIGSFTTSSTAVACLSLDGGQSSLVQLNQSGKGSDFGDFRSSGYIQSAYTYKASSYPTFTVKTAEFEMMEAIGWDPSSAAQRALAAVGEGAVNITSFAPVPEPSTWALMTVGAAAVGALASVRRRSRAAV